SVCENAAFARCSSDAARPRHPPHASTISRTTPICLIVGLVGRPPWAAASPLAGSRARRKGGTKASRGERPPSHLRNRRCASMPHYHSGMAACPEDLFAVEFRDVPGKGVVAARGLKFQEGEQALRRRYNAALQTTSLNVLLGEAALWVLWPSTIAIWAFPLLLWRLPIDISILVTIGLFLAIQIAHMTFYRRRLNYAAFVLANRALQVTAYAA